MLEEHTFCLKLLINFYMRDSGVVPPDPQGIFVLERAMWDRTCAEATLCYDYVYVGVGVRVCLCVGGGYSWASSLGGANLFLLFIHTNNKTPHFPPA